MLHSNGKALHEFVDTSEYSDDGRYRWWYERRWANGPALCWVGLNPSTGDTSGRPRPTLRKVVERAAEADLSAAIIVNLFSWRATDPKDLKRAANVHDIVGERTDEVVAAASDRAGLTLAAWGAHGVLQDRWRSVSALLHNPVCLGVTKSGQPRHPLYVAATTTAVPYRP
jgi:hypothetical protein